MAKPTLELTPRNSSDLQWYEWLIPGYREGRLIDHLGNRYAQPAKMAIRDVVRHTLPKPMRLSLETIRPDSLSERNFSNAFNKQLGEIVINELNRQRPDWRDATMKGDTIRIGVHGSSYIDNYGGTKVKRSLLYRTSHPLGQIETTLGSFNVQATKNDITVSDTYDWNPKVHLNMMDPYGLFRNIMGAYGTPDTAPDNEKTKISIRNRRTQK